MDVRLSLGKDLAHLGDIVLQGAFVQGVSNLLSADKCQNDNFLLIVGDFGELVLKELDV